MACTLTVLAPTTPSMHVGPGDSIGVPIRNEGDDRTDVMIRVYSTLPTTPAIPVATVGIKLAGFKCYRGTYTYPVGWSGGPAPQTIGLLARIKATNCGYDPAKLPQDDRCAEANVTFVVP